MKRLIGTQSKDATRDTSVDCIILMRHRFSPHRIIGSFMTTADNPTSKQLRKVALKYIQTAWDEAIIDGLDSDMIANAALFAALCDLVSSYGEENVANMANELPTRIDQGEFSVSRVVH